MAVDHVESRPLALEVGLWLKSVRGRLVQVFDEGDVLNASWLGFVLVHGYEGVG